jgi:hypothetical protein
MMEKKMMTSSEQKVGKVIRVEWDTETDTVRLVMEITDPTFKSRVIHSKSYEDIMSISGKDVMIVASKSKKDENDNI